MQLSLDELFPAAPPHERAPRKPFPHNNREHNGEYEGRIAQEEIPTRWAAVYALELRGLDKQEIAKTLSLSPSTVTNITLDERYIAYRERHLAALDHDFVAMKPLAFDALRGGLRSQDENTALRASEQWFKAAGFGGFARTPEQPTSLTAEDVVAALLTRQQVAVQVNVNVPQPSPPPPAATPSDE